MKISDLLTAVSSLPDAATVQFCNPSGTMLVVTGFADGSFNNAPGTPLALAGVRTALNSLDQSLSIVFTSIRANGSKVPFTVTRLEITGTTVTMLARGEGV